MRPPNHPIVDVKSGVVTPEWLSYLSRLSGEDAGGVTVITRGGDASTEPPIFINPPAGGGAPSGPVDAGSLVGTTLAPNVIISSLIAVGTLQVGALGPGFKVDLGTVNLSGHLPWPNLPTGAGIWDASVSLTGPISAQKFIGDGSGLTALPPHHVTHEVDGLDVITLDLLGVPSNITRLDATTTAHGLLPRLSGVPTEFLNGAGGWSVPAGGGSGGGSVEEVFVGPADPGGGYELWYDTDDPYAILPTPLHAATHSAGGIDAITITNLAGFPGNDVAYLRGDGVWAVPPGGGGGGGDDEVFVGPTDPGTGYELWYDTDDPFSLTTLAPHAPTHSAGASDPVTITNLAGFPGGIIHYLRADGTWAVPPGGGGGGGGVVDALYWVSTGHLDLTAEVNLGALATGYLRITTVSGTATPSSVAAIPQSDVTNLTADLALKAPLASPALTGTPTAPTATLGTNTTQLATTAFVMAAVGGVTVGSGTVGRLSKWTTTTGLGDSIVTETAGAISVAGSAILSGRLDLLESALSTPPADTARLNAVDINGFTAVASTDSTGTTLALTRDSVFVAKAKVAITKGQAVYLSGAQGANEEVQLARADSTTTLPAIGLALDSGAVNAFVRVLVQGKLTGIDTSAWTEGARLFVSATTAGALATTAPAYPNFTQRVAIVTRAHATQGELLVLSAGATLTTHAPSHAAGGFDPLTITTLAGFPGGTTTFLRADGTFATTPGDEVFIGTDDPGAAYELWFDTDEVQVAPPDMYGPASAVANNITTFADTSGKVLKDSGVAVSSLAPLASPTFTGTPAAPTAPTATNTTQIATTAFVKAAIVATPLDTLAVTTDITTLNASTTAHGLLPKLSGTTTTFLRGDGTWATPPSDVTGPASSIDNNVVVFSGTTGKVIKDGGKALPTGAIVGTTDTQTLSGKTLTTPTIADFTNAGHTHQNAAGGGTLVEAALALTDITTNNASATKHGFLPKLSGSTAQFLRGDGAWVAPTGSGDVIGPAGAVTNNLANFADATGKVIKDTGIAAVNGDLTTGRVINMKGGNPFHAWTDMNQPADARAFIALNTGGGLAFGAFNDAFTTQQGNMNITMRRDSSVSFGGSVYLRNTAYIYGRNAANNTDVPLFTFWNDDKLYIGSTGGDAALVLRSAGNINCMKPFLQAYGAYLYPGSATGEQMQTAWYLASHSSYGLYTNTGLMTQGPVYTASQLYIYQNAGFLNILNIAGNGWCQVITADGANRTCLGCSGLRLRFIASVNAGAVGGGSTSVGSLGVTVDGVGDVRIPYY